MFLLDLNSPSILPKGLILTIDILALLLLLHMCISYAHWYSIVYKIVLPFFNVKQLASC